MKLFSLLVAISALTMSSSAFAHPGHGESGPSHYLSEPEHVVSLAVMMGLVALVFCGRQIFNQQRWVAEEQRVVDAKHQD